MKLNYTAIGTTFAAGAIGLGAFFAILPGLSLAKSGIKASPGKFQKDHNTSAPFLAKSARKPTAEARRRYLAIEKDRQENYVNPILLAIKNGNDKRVRYVWNAYKIAGFAEDPWLRLQLAKFFAKRGDKKEAHEQLEAILYPPKGHSSSLQRSGEVMALYKETSTRSDQLLTNATVRQWNAQVSAPGESMASNQNLPAEAKIEWLKAQELEAQSNPSEALESYRKVALLAPKSFFAQKQFGLALRRAGKFSESKQSMIRAYALAPTSERGSIKRLGQISKQDLRKLGL